MKKNIIGILAIMLSFWPTALRAVGAPEEVVTADTIAPATAPEAFIDFDINVMEILDKGNRMAMVERYKAGRDPIGQNSHEGTSRIDTLTDDYVRATISPASRIQIKRLTGKKGETLFMTIYTIGGEDAAADSDIRFWNSSLKELPRKQYFRIPEIRDFFEIPRGCATTYKEIEGMIPFPTVTYEAAPGTDNITARQTAGKYINLDDWNIIKIFEKPEGIKYEWTGKRYELPKEKK